MEKEKEKTIYSLGLHETMFVSEQLRPGLFKRYEITRVPGGWIYAFEYPIIGGVDTSLTFVPLNDEFIKKNNKK